MVISTWPYHSTCYWLQDELGVPECPQPINFHVKKHLATYFNPGINIAKTMSHCITGMGLSCKDRDLHEGSTDTPSGKSISIAQGPIPTYLPLRDKIFRNNQ